MKRKFFAENKIKNVFPYLSFINKLHKYLYQDEIILFVESYWCKSSYSTNRPGGNSVPQAATTTFAFFFLYKSFFYSVVCL